MTAHCHVRVREVAQQAAGQLYERLMGDNYYYDLWKQQNPGLSPQELEKRFVEKNWGRCLDFARATLAAMLRSPNVNERLKDEIMDVLEKDWMLVKGRGRVPASMARN